MSGLRSPGEAQGVRRVTGRDGGDGSGGGRDGGWGIEQGVRARFRAWGQNAQKGTEDAPQGAARVSSAAWFSFF
jgi:hypothetical protein